jgi:hypothetical protein
MVTHDEANEQHHEETLKADIRYHNQIVTFERKVARLEAEIYFGKLSQHAAIHTQPDGQHVIVLAQLNATQHFTHVVLPEFDICRRRLVGGGRGQYRPSIFLLLGRVSVLLCVAFEKGAPCVDLVLQRLWIG